MKTDRQHPQYELIYTTAKWTDGWEATSLILAAYDPYKGRWLNVTRHVIFSDSQSGNPADGLAELARSLDHWLSYDDGRFCWAMHHCILSVLHDFDAEDLLGYPDAAQYEDFQVVRSVRAEFDGTEDVRFVDQIAEAEGR